MPRTRSNLHEISFQTAGSSGEPVLLIMGFTMRGEAWRFQIDALSKRHRVAWFDHAGLGNSGPIRARRLTMRDMADDALSVMDALEWPTAHVVGLSMGGMIAQHLALREPGRVQSLTLAATHPGGKDHLLPPAKGLWHFAKSHRGKSQDRLDALSRLLFGQQFREENPERAREMLREDFASPPPIAVSLAQVGAIAAHDTRSRLRELSRHRTLIVRPGEDLLVDARGSDTLAAHIDGAWVERFEDAGHAVTRQCADPLNELLLEHFFEAETATS